MDSYLWVWRECFGERRGTHPHTTLSPSRIHISPSLILYKPLITLLHPNHVWVPSVVATPRHRCSTLGGTKPFQGSSSTTSTRPKRHPAITLPSPCHTTHHPPITLQSPSHHPHITLTSFSKVRTLTTTSRTGTTPSCSSSRRWLLRRK